MPIEVRDLRALEGPNIYYMQPAVKLQLRAGSDIRRAVSDAVKIWSQQIGVVIGALRQDVQPEGDGFLITTTWTTPLPLVGERIAEAIVADLQAAERHDDEYSHDDLLFEIIGERKREEPSLAVLQLYAEAQIRDLPFLPLGKGRIMLGSGARGWVFDATEASLGLQISPPWDAIGAIPIVAVTGTNGKTTTTRLIAHIVASLGKRVGRTDTDGIFIDGQQVEDGDWAGWGGARRVLTDPNVDVATLETSRGGILRRGLGFSACDVGVVTNISADHLGEFGITTIEQMADVKSLVVRATRPDGLVVLNADDPLVLQMGQLSAAPVCLYSRDPDNSVPQTYLDGGGAVIRSDGTQIEIIFDTQRGTIALADIPITFGGAARHNVENVMAAIGACLGLGIPIAPIAAALRTFEPTASHNANRLNVFQHDGITVVFDYAHNVAGLSALIAFGQQVQAQSGGKLLIVLGGPGDRPDDMIHELGRMSGAAADHVFLHEEERYLRGRAIGETTALYRAGVEASGRDGDSISAHPNEIDALDTALAAAQSGDVVLLAAHAQRAAMLDRLERWQGGGAINDND